MFHDHSHLSEQLATLAAQVRVADEATPEMFSELMGQTCRWASTQDGAYNVSRLHQLIDADALTQAALTLIELELPQWKLRRIAYDDGEWHCALSRQRELPEWLDQAIEIAHGSLTLALAGVYIETIRQIEASGEPSRPSVPQVRADQFEPLYCEKFA